MWTVSYRRPCLAPKIRENSLRFSYYFHALSQMLSLESKSLHYTEPSSTGIIVTIMFQCLVRRLHPVDVRRRSPVRAGCLWRLYDVRRRTYPSLLDTPAS